MTDPTHFARRTLLRLAAASSTLLGTSRGAAAAGAALPSAELDSRIWTGPFEARNVWGYVDKHSVVPGEGFALMLSTGPTLDGAEGRVEFYRIGASESGQDLVWTSRSISVPRQLVSSTAAAIGANWTPAFSAIDTSSWQPGYYSADFVGTNGSRERRVAQIIVRNPKSSGAILLRLSTNTYQAYNPWGGHCLYPRLNDPASQGAIVSFDRPTPPAFFEYEVFLLRFLEALGARAGFAVDYASNFDVHRDRALLRPYPLVISGSHDEYWSKEEFDAFEHRIHRSGKNTLFLGANAAYWQARYGDLNRPPGAPELGRQLISYKSLDDPLVQRGGDVDPMLLVTARFRDAARRPESMLMGVAYQNWFQPRDDGGPRFSYHVADISAPFFEGTGYKVGDIAADVVGYEWDNRDPVGDGTRLWDAEKSHNRILPAAKLQVLFNGDVTAEDGTPGRAEAVYFESKAGAKVFSAGSIRWAWGLGRPGFAQPAFQRFNENLVRNFLGQDSSSGW